MSKAFPCREFIPQYERYRVAWFSYQSIKIEIIMKVRSTNTRNKKREISKRKTLVNSRFLKVNQKPDADSDRIHADQLFSLFTAAIIKKNTDFVR
jgi:hypothetical protein